MYELWWEIAPIISWWRTLPDESWCNKETNMKRITTEEYQDFTLSTWIGNDSATESELRLVCGVAEEAGEVAGKVKKWHRGDYNDDVESFRRDVQAEMGDLLWYVAMLHNHYDLVMEDSMVQNVEKLLDRQSRSVIKGSGDAR